MAFDGLSKYLRECGLDRVVLSYGDIERLNGAQLPASARKYPAPWANSSSYASAWRSAGYRATRAGVLSGHIEFVRDRFVETPSGAQVHGEGTRPTVNVAGADEVLLVGCVKTKLDHVAPAKDLYISDLFRKRRAYAESSGRPWFILSALHGLLRPETLIEPYDVYLAKESDEYRRAWGEWVAAHLVREMGPLAGHSFEVSASQAYADAVRAPIERRGGAVSTPLAGLAQGEQLAWYAQQLDRVGDVPLPVDDMVQALSDRTTAVPAGEVPAQQLDSAGLYAWWVDERGAAELSAGVGYPVSGLIYAGQTGATTSRQGIERSSTLRDRIVGNHLRGRITSSTFRCTLAAILVSILDLRPNQEGDALAGDGERQLSAWMADHLSVVWLPVSDRASLGAVEEQVVQRLNPPLNLQHVGPTRLRERLRELRREVSRAQP